MSLRRADALWLASAAVAGWLLAGVGGAAVVVLGTIVGLFRPRLVAAYAAVVLVAAAVATLVEAPVGVDESLVTGFVSSRPVATALGLGAGLMLVGAVLAGVRAEAAMEPVLVVGPAVPAGSGRAGGTDRRRSPLTGLTVVAAIVAVVLAVMETPAVRLLAPVPVLAVGLAWLAVWLRRR